MDLDVLARLVSAMLWIAVLCRYILDVVPQSPRSRGEGIVQVGLGFLFALIAFSAARAIWVELEPSWLTYAYPATALVMVVGQHWDRLTFHRP